MYKFVFVFPGCVHCLCFFRRVVAVVVAETAVGISVVIVVVVVGDVFSYLLLSLYI